MKADDNILLSPSETASLCGWWRADHTVSPYGRARPFPAGW